MSHILRAARASDLQALYEMAKSTGGGFTNLPPDRKSLSAKLERAANALAGRMKKLPMISLYSCWKIKRLAMFAAPAKSFPK